MSPDELEAIQETVDILRDRDLVESIRRSREEASAGQRRLIVDPRQGELNPPQR